MKPTRLLFFVLLLPCLVFGQGDLKKADAQFQSQQYYNARITYKSAAAKAKSKVEKARIDFQIGECCRMLNEPDNAIMPYTKAINNGYTDDVVYLRRADMYHMLGQCANAINDYNEYKKRVPSDAATADAGIAACNLAATWAGEKNRWKISDVKEVNTPTSDFCPMWLDKKHNGLVITSKRPGQTGSGLDPNTGMQYSDLFETRQNKNGQWSSPTPVQGAVNTPVSNDGSSCITKNGTHMFFTRCDQKKKQLITCKIFYSEKKGNSWSTPVLIDFGLSQDVLDSFNFRHPAVSMTEDVMVFSSDMPGVVGGVHSDLWISYFDKKTKTWGKPVNLGSTLNTSGREGFPYISDNGDLYFSSDGLQGMGGLDIFKAPKVSNTEWKWGTPENLKMPFNSPMDDFGIVFNGKKRDGYLTSNREGGRGADDIYHFWYDECIVPLIGVVTDTVNHLPVANTVVILDYIDGTSEVARTDGQGRYEFKIHENETFIVSDSVDAQSADAKAKQFFSPDPKQRGRFTTVGLADSCPTFTHNFDLRPIPNDVEIYFPAVLYGLDSATLRPQSKDSLDYLYKLLIENPNLVIEIDAYTDCRGSADHNRRLSQARAEACVNYLVNEKGIPKERLVAKGWGEDHPLKLANGTVLTEKYINSQPAGKREDLHKLNRRTTFKVIGTNYVDPKHPQPPARQIKVRAGYFDNTGDEVPDENDGN